MESTMTSSTSSSARCYDVELKEELLQDRLDQWIDVATQLFEILEKKGNWRSILMNMNARDSYRHDDEEFEAVRFELDGFCRKSARLSADLKFSKQKEASLRNALYEKNKQIEVMKQESKQLLRQLNEIEDSFKNQLNVATADLQTKRDECLKWKSTCFTSQQELATVKENLEQATVNQTELEKTVSHLKTERLHNSAALAKHEEERQTYQHQIDVLKSELRQSESESNERISKIKEDNDVLEKSASELKAMLAKLESSSLQKDVRAQTSERKLEQYEELVEIQKSRILEMETAKTTAREELHQLKDALISKEAAQKVFNEKELSLNNQIEKLADKDAEKTKAIEQLTKAIQEHEADGDRHHIKEEKLQAVIYQLEKELQKERMTIDQMSTVKQSEQLLRQENNQNTEELIHLRQQVLTADKTIDAQKQQIEDLENKLAAAQCDRSETENSASPVIASMRRLQGLLHDRERDLRRSQLRINELENRVTVLSQDTS